MGQSAPFKRLDPEDMREIVGAYHKCVAETVVRFDGFVAKYMGDGVLIYFGYPQAILTHIHCGDYAAGVAQINEVVDLAEATGALYWKALAMTPYVCAASLIGGYWNPPD
jgi:class 3 adenylate cyclase